MKIATVVGARPQFIKTSLISQMMRESQLTECMIHTGQHFDKNMSDIFFSELKLVKPHYNLNIGKLSQGAMTGRMIEAIEDVLIKEKPSAVLVYGDTNSTLAASLAASKLHIPIAHVEAGLRSFNKKMPEEINRVVTDHLSDLLFAPTDAAYKQLINEGIEKSNIVQSGDVMLDVALCFKYSASKLPNGLIVYGIKPKEYVLTTIHRQENTENKKNLEEIFQGLNLVAKKFHVVMPMHPRTKKMLAYLDVYQKWTENLTIIEPQSYIQMLKLIEDAKVVATDSGGLQKEAYFLKVPCITLRSETEWIELVEHGYNQLIPAKKGAIFDAICSLNTKNLKWDEAFYGKGSASKTIVNAIKKRLGHH